MKKITLFIIVLLTILVFNPTKLFADAANIIHAPGGNVKVMNSEFIKMKNEQIYITVCEDKCKYRVEYTFVNTGDEQTVLMGFPNSKRIRGRQAETVYGINDFLAFEGTSKLEVFRKDEENQDDNIVKSLYECFEVHFKKGETKHITNTYSQEYVNPYRDNFEVTYILTTGASWKGTIDTISVFIDSEIPKNQLIPRTAYFHEIYEENGEMKLETTTRYFGLSISPGNYIIEQGIYKMVFTDIEPDFDIVIGKPELFVGVSASSELEDKNGRYSIKNIIDERPETAWVEGKNDSGINEFITIGMSEYIESDRVEDDYIYGSYKIEKIGIINGYAKDENTYKQNNRVKKLLLKCNNEFSETHYRLYTLKDTMAMQYIEFDKPIFMDRIKFTIRDVYKGSKWDDTCISEIRIFPY